ncbi:MAG: hypothetical protein AAF363_12340 [Bacteroidota bacterium]
MPEPVLKRTRAQESRAAIERLYIIMRHLFIRGGYKPMGVSGEALVEALLTLSPEIYGSIADPQRVEVDGLLYIIDRLPRGIEECRFIRLVSMEGMDNSGFDVIIPPKRRRNCYRIDEEQIYIELTRGRSDIYDILTHLTFLYVEAGKILRNSIDAKGAYERDWKMLKNVVEAEDRGEEIDFPRAFSYLSTVMGCTYEEAKVSYDMFAADPSRNSIFHFVYWLGKLAIDEQKGNKSTKESKDREITFSAKLRERIGHHLYGEQWATNIKSFIFENGLIERPVHIISANLHSVMNVLYAKAALENEYPDHSLDDMAKMLSLAENSALREKVHQYAKKNGMSELVQTSGTNLIVQIIDTEHLNLDSVPSSIHINKGYLKKHKPLIIVMDYAFGEQAYEAMDELLKPLEIDGESKTLNVVSISIMGKAGILEGDKGDIMVPNAHVFEGTADNYPFHNELSKEDFEGNGLLVCEGPMVTVLGTSLQNKDILKYFLESSWKAIGLEMEGAHYQKAIQSAAKVRKSISNEVKVLYAYYASDNPLLTGKTLSSGGLGLDGVKPTYLITQKILERIFE